MSSASSAALRRSLVRRAITTSITSATPRSFVLRHPSTFLPTTSRPLSRPLQHLTSTSSTRHFTRSAIMSKGGVHNLGSKKDFDAALKEDSNLVVLDCFATWCGPCKAIAPQVVKFSDEFTDARFYKIDVDEVPDVAQELGIRAMPTFMLFKDGERVDEVVGANPNALRAAIEKHAK